MRLTKAQKSGVRRAIAEHLAYYIADGYGEPLKDVEQNDSWPNLPDDASDDDIDALGDACNDYLDTAMREVVRALRKLR